MILNLSFSCVSFPISKMMFNPHVLGINRGGSFVLVRTLFGAPCPSAEEKSLVEISPCPCVSLSNTDDLSQSYCNFQHPAAEGKREELRGKYKSYIILVRTRLQQD